MVTDHSQAGRRCSDVYLEAAFAQKVCYFFYTFFWDDFERSGGHHKSQCQSYSKFSPSPACLLLCFSPSVPPTPTHLVHQTPGLPRLALLCQTLRGAAHWHE